MKDKKQIIDSIKPLVDTIIKAQQIMGILNGTEIGDAIIILESVIYQIAENSEIDVWDIYSDMVICTQRVKNKME